jgi:hypothetical protein
MRCVSIPKSRISRDRVKRIVPAFVAVLLLTVLAGGAPVGARQRVAVASNTGGDGRAGTCYAFYPDPWTGTGRPYIPLAQQAGSRWDRFDFTWPVIEPSPGTWHFEGHDDVVADLRAGGITNIVGILLWTPNWAATSRAASTETQGGADRPWGWYAPVPGGATSLSAAQPRAASSPPHGLYEAWDDWTEADGDPANLWGRYVHTVVSRYGDRVKHWEMWNEPEWDYFWTGTSVDYAQLLKVGYQATKAACPDCQVLFGGLHYWANTEYYKWVLNTLKNDPQAPANDYYFDVMSVHLYSRSSTAYDVVNTIREDMTARVSDHPIWLTETGVPVWNDGSVDPVPLKYDYAATQEEAASYVIQSYANAWAAGVERYFFFRTNDEDMTEYFGLVRNDFSLRPAYGALQVASTYLISPTMVTRATEPGGIRRVTLWGTPHGKVSVLWNRTPDEVTLEYGAALPGATLIDQVGVTRTVEASDGVYEIALPGATCNLVSNPSDYIIGGAPRVVVEEDTVSPSVPTVGPLPATTYSDTVSVPLNASDDGAGVWGFDVQVREAGAGDWTDWLGLDETAEEWAPGYAGVEHGLTYCFRARAWDRAGNRGPWSDGTTCSQVDLARAVELSVGPVYGDEDGDGSWDVGEGEVQLHGLRFRLVEGSSADVVSPTVGDSWELTTTLAPGEYTVVAEPSGWLSPPPGWLPRRLDVSVAPGAGVLEVVFSPLGLLRHRSSSYLPLIAD